MKTRNLLRVLLSCALLLGALACDSSNPVAPTGTVLTVIANPTFIPLNGTAIITVTGFRPDGNPLFPGTQINLTTNLGTLGASTITVGDNGRAQTTLTGSGQQGMAMVTASTPGADAMAEATVQIGDDATTQPVLTVTATPNTASLNEIVDISVVVQNSDGSQFTGQGNVQLETSLGTLIPPDGLVPVVNGRATAQLDTGEQVGTATITAFFGSAMAAMTMVAIENQRPSLIVTVTPNDIATNEDATVTVLARDENDNPLGEGLGVELFTTLGCFPTAPGSDGCDGEPTSTTVLTGPNGRAEATYNSGELGGTATITAILGNSEAVTTTVNIRSIAGSISLSADRTSVQRPTGTGTTEPVRLTAVVVDTAGRPSANKVVVFVPSVGSLTLPNGNPTGGAVTTNIAGIAEVIWMASADQLQGVNTVTITASVQDESGISDSVQITITN